MEKLFNTLVAVCIITHLVRSGYEILKHRKLLKPGKVSFLIIFTNMALLWASWFVVCSIDVHKINLAGSVRYAGISLFVLGLVVFFAGLWTIKSFETYEGDLITHGIYSRIRHPMYLGFILWSIGLPLYAGGGISFFLSIPFIANILFWRHLEEKELEKRFPAYAAYKKRTLF